jgi:putative acyl-CoA dehydrogenase
MRRRPPVPCHAVGVATSVTHRVANQPPPLEGYDVFGENRPLVEALDREGAGWAAADAHRLGRIAGAPDTIGLGFAANAHSPTLRTHDRWGHRVDEVEFHPAWHALMTTASEWGLHCLPWEQDRPGVHAARAALSMTFSQVEAGHGCPVTMTFAAVPALRAEPVVGDEWVPRLLARAHEPELGAGKRSAKCGMAMTEKQGGSDVRANETRAEALDGDDGWHALTGHKWFCSAPMCDLFLVLAQVDEGLTCFALPRILPDGERNAGFRLQRLKDKLGNRSNASSEVEFHRALARRVGPPGRGVPTIIEMVGHTRLDCVIGTAAQMRQAVAQATHHAAHRAAFGRLLIDQPLMEEVLADLCVESEAATLSAMRLARAYDEGDHALARLGTAVLKYWVCKRGPMLAAEALECLGGNGYVEDSGLPRIYREMPVNSVWEGSGNVMCLDVLRALARQPTLLERWWAEVDEARGADRRLDAYVADLRDELADPVDIERRARRLVERLALALQGSLLVRFGHAASADAFCGSRLAGAGGLAFGAAAPGADAGAIVAHHRPRVG